MGSLLIALAMGFMASTGYCLTVGPTANVKSISTAPIQISAEVVPILELTLTIYDGATTTSPVVTVMNFNTLVLTQSTLTYASSHVFTVQATAISSGRAYSLLQSGTQLVDPAGDKLPLGCQIVTPNALKVTPNAGGTYGKQQQWVGNNLILYTSNTAGQRDTVNARYTLSSDSTLGSTDKIDADQHGGSYTATVTYTLTLN